MTGVLGPAIMLSGASTDVPSAFVQVATGENHTCALRSTGHVECWGFNDQGQLDVPAGARF